jgi:uncharacterized membrane protein SpoIIM required for sporulation
MNYDEFYQARRHEWEMLSGLVENAQRDVHRLSPQDIERLASLYRAAASDLALVKRDFHRQPATKYLNQLVARAHGVLYQGEPLAFNRLRDFVTTGFPRLFRETLIFTVIAFVMFAIPATAAGISTAIVPQSAEWLLPAEVQSLIPIVQDKKLWTDIPVQERPFASAFIMQNNIRVSFLAFSSGLTGGLLTLWVLVENGLIFGGLLGITSYYGVGSDLLAFVIGHGVIELSVTFMAGGSGLMLGWAIIHPGLLRRRDALGQAAQKAVRLLAGAASFLVIAGLIEGFVSPSETVPWQVKAAIGITSGILLYTYLCLAGREKSPRYIRS